MFYSSGSYNLGKPKIVLMLYLGKKFYNKTACIRRILVAF